MRKAAFVVGATITNLLATAATALAQSSLPGPNDPFVRGDVVTPPGATGGIAFTGGDVLLLGAVALVLLTAGTVMFRLGRRRGASVA